MRKIILIGGGTFSTVIIESILENPIYAEYEIIGFLDDGKICRENYEYPLLGKIDDIYKFADKDTLFVMSIGSPQVRKMISERYPDINYLSVIDKSAYISKKAKLGKGCIVLKNVIINAFSDIGDFAIVNAGAIIDHHCKIGKCSHIGHGVIVWKSAEVDEDRHIYPGQVLSGQ